MTRRGRDIGKLNFLLFSMLHLPVLFCQSTPPAASSTPSTDITQMAFPNLFLGDIQRGNSETFCIFRNYGLTVQGLRDVSVNHITPRWRLSYENKGSNEWNTQTGMISHRLSLMRNQQISVGIGGLHTQSQWGGLLDLQYLFQTDRTGTFTAHYRNVLTPGSFQGDALKRLLLGPSIQSMEGSWQYNEQLFQLTWVGNSTKKLAKSTKRGGIIPFAQAVYSPQQQYIELGGTKPLQGGFAAMMAINSTQQPLRWGIYYTTKSWLGGLEGKWLRPLGMVYGWQVRYRWE